MVKIWKYASPTALLPSINVIITLDFDTAFLHSGSFVLNNRDDGLPSQHQSLPSNERHDSSRFIILEICLFEISLFKCYNIDYKSSKCSDKISSPILRKIWKKRVKYTFALLNIWCHVTVFYQSHIYMCLIFYITFIDAKGKIIQYKRYFFFV